MGKRNYKKSKTSIWTIIWLLFTATIVYYIFWWAFVVLIIWFVIIGFFLVHFLNVSLWRYTKKTFFYTILSYIILCGLLFLWCHILAIKVPEINHTFIQWSEKISTYITIGSNKKWQPILQPNEQWIILETLSNMTITWQIQ